MRTLPCLIIVTLLSGGLAAAGHAQVPLPEMEGQTAGPQSQVLEFTAGGGTISLTVDAAVAGSEPIEVTDTSTEIHWENGFGVTSKLAVSTICPGQSFSLFVELQVTSWGDGTQGTVQPEVELVDGMIASDLIRDLPSAAPGREGYATLQYRAAATVSQGTSAEHGDDLHTVTYTILEQ